MFANKHRPANQQNKQTKKALEKLKSFRVVSHFQHPSRTSLLPKVHSPEAPPKGVFGRDWTPQRRSSPGQRLQRQSTSRCLGWLQGSLWWSPCLHQRDSEPLPSLSATGRANWEHPSLHAAKRKVFITGGPACCLMPDTVHVCDAGISVSHLAKSEGHRLILNKARDHLVPCTQKDFLFTSRDASLFMLVSFFCSPTCTYRDVFMFIKNSFSFFFYGSCCADHPLASNRLGLEAQKCCSR